MTKQILFDVESTGLDPASGDRIVSLAAVEIEHLLPTGRFIHFYVNPERESNPHALAVHGLTTEFLADKPKFAEVAGRVFKILNSATLVIHNAPFDLKFINAELNRVGNNGRFDSRSATCTLDMARRQFGNSKGRNTLDALTSRFSGPDLRAKTGKHGALVDCLTLLNVYRGLVGVKPLEWLDSDLSPFLGGSNEGEGSSSSERVSQVTQPDASDRTSNVGACSG